MFVFDENNFKIDDFIQNNLKNIEFDILYSRINDIITFQNWTDRSLSFGTDYFNDFENLKYYKLDDTCEEITYDTIFNAFKEIYDWFLDDENYLKSVNKLINVILGNDK